jgi:hypothetical protein
LIGPRYGSYDHRGFTPFAEVLFGAGHGSVSTDVSQFSPITLPDDVSAKLTASRTSFAMMAGVIWTSGSPSTLPIDCSTRITI